LNDGVSLEMVGADKFVRPHEHLSIASFVRSVMRC